MDTVEAVYVAYLEIPYEGVQILGVHRTLEGAKKRCRESYERPYVRVGNKEPEESLAWKESDVPDLEMEWATVGGGIGYVAERMEVGA